MSLNVSRNLFNIAELKRIIVPLNSGNYATLKVQSRMALIKENFWSLVGGTEPVPKQTDADKYTKYLEKKNKALAAIVLIVDPKLLYLIGDPENPQ